MVGAEGAVAAGGVPVRAEPGPRAGAAAALAALAARGAPRLRRVRAQVSPARAAGLEKHSTLFRVNKLYFRFLIPNSRLSEVQWKMQVK